METARVSLDGVFVHSGVRYYVGGLFCGQLVTLRTVNRRLQVVCPCGKHLRLARRLEAKEPAPNSRPPLVYPCQVSTPAEERRAA